MLDAFDDRFMDLDGQLAQGDTRELMREVAKWRMLVVVVVVVGPAVCSCPN